MTAGPASDGRDLPGDGLPVAGYVARRHAPLLEATGDPAIAGPVDELLGRHGRVRPGHRDLAASVDLLGTTGLLAKRAQARRYVEDDGVTYGAAPVPGVPRPAGAAPRRRWALDPLPLVLEADEWFLEEILDR